MKQYLDKLLFLFFFLIFITPLLHATQDVPTSSQGKASATADIDMHFFPDFSNLPTGHFDFFSESLDLKIDDAKGTNANDEIIKVSLNLFCKDTLRIHSNNLNPKTYSKILIAFRDYPDVTQPKSYISSAVQVYVKNSIFYSENPDPNTFVASPIYYKGKTPNSSLKCQTQVAEEDPSGPTDTDTHCIVRHPLKNQLELTLNKNYFFPENSLKKLNHVKGPVFTPYIIQQGLSIQAKRGKNYPAGANGLLFPAVSNQNISENHLAKTLSLPLASAASSDLGSYKCGAQNL